VRVLLNFQMPSTAELLAEAETVRAENPKRGEEIYKQILDASKSAVSPDELRDQETALVKLGELYRDQKYVHSAFSLLGLLIF
jgi:26S proteasome regulatory subunit N6